MNYSGDMDVPDVNFWCKHSIAALVWLHNNNGRKRIANECGSVEAKQLQNKLNGQFNSQNNNGNGAQKAPSNSEIDPSAKIFLESDQLDEAQILTGEGSVERAVALPRLKEASVMRDPKSLNRWSYNSAEFLEQCREAIAQVREKKDAVEANEQPLQNDNGNKRKVMMDKKLRTWLVESDGSKKEISCREICEKFESKQNPSIVTAK